MINFVFWRKTGHLDNIHESTRFIVKNIGVGDVLIFNSLSDWCRDKNNLMYNINTQCGTGLPCDLTDEDKTAIHSSIYSATELDMEELHNRKHIRNIVLFGFEMFPPKLVTTLICDFATKAEILGISDFVGLTSTVLTRVKNLKAGGMNKDQVRLTMMLEDKYHHQAIEQALFSCYTMNKYDVREVQFLDGASSLWSNGINKK